MFLVLIPGVTAATVSISDPYAEGSNIVIDVSIADVEFFDTAGFAIDYRQSSLELFEGKTAGDFAPGASVVVNAANGMVFINAPGFNGFAGSGVLAKILFNPILPASKSTLQLTGIELGDNYGMPIDVNTESNIVEYDPGTTQPRDPECGNSQVESGEECESASDCESRSGETASCNSCQCSYETDDDDDDDDGNGGGGGGGGGGSWNPTPAPVLKTPKQVDEEVEETKVAEPKAVEKLAQKVVTSPWFILPLIIAVLIVGGFFSYKHFNRVKAERAESGAPGQRGAGAAKPKAQGLTLKASGLAKPVAVKPAVPVKKPTDPALAYIQSCRANGFTDVQIRAELTKQGWSDADIAKKMGSAA
jgi:hypothetical protein